MRGSVQHCSVFPLSYNDGATGNGALNTATLGTGDQAFFTYDPLNRLTEELVKSPDGTTLFKHAIAYKNRENNQTTNLVQFYNVRRADGSLIAGNRYSYDTGDGDVCWRDYTDGSMLRVIGDPTSNSTAHNLHPDAPNTSNFSHLYG